MNENISTSPVDAPSFPNALLTGAALAGGALLLSGRKASAATKPLLTFADIPGSGDVQVLNYALALEALETELYRQALLKLQGGGEGITGLNLSAANPGVAYVTRFASVEKAHRDFLDKALGAQSILKTSLKNATFDFGFTDPAKYPDEVSVLTLIQSAEALGVQAYLGAIPKFAVKSPYLQTAAAIQGTEARHTAAITAAINALTNGSQEVAPKKGEGLGGAGIDLPLDPDSVLAKVTGPNGYLVLP